MWATVVHNKSAQQIISKDANERSNMKADKKADTNAHARTLSPEQMSARNSAWQDDSRKSSTKEKSFEHTPVFPIKYNPPKSKEKLKTSEHTLKSPLKYSHTKLPLPDTLKLFEPTQISIKFNPPKYHKKLKAAEHTLKLPMKNNPSKPLDTTKSSELRFQLALKFDPPKPLDKTKPLENTFPFGITPKKTVPSKHTQARKVNKASPATLTSLKHKKSSVVCKRSMISNVKNSSKSSTSQKRCDRKTQHSHPGEAHSLDYCPLPGTPGTKL